MTTATYRAPEGQWNPGTLAVHVHDAGRFAVVVDGRPVFSGTGYTPGPFHDSRMAVADILAFAYHRVGDGQGLPVSGQVWPDDIAAVGDFLENVT